MITKQQSVEYLISTFGNYTGSHLAEHLDDVSHDVITDYLRSERLTSRSLWDLVAPLISDGPDAFLILDDSVHAGANATPAASSWSSASTAALNTVWCAALASSTWCTARAVPAISGRLTFASMRQTPMARPRTRISARCWCGRWLTSAWQARTVLFDAWYAAADNLKLIQRLGLIFFTTLKENRLVSLNKEAGYIHLDQIQWTPERLQHGVLVKLKEVPFKVRLFKLVATHGDIDWVITNGPDETVTAQVAQDANDVRWQVEELHRGLKQLTGSEKCQCRKARSQRNHLACCYHAWLSLKVKAQQLNQTLYQVKSDLLRDYLRAELRNPRIPAFQLA